MKRAIPFLFVLGACASEAPLPEFHITAHDFSYTVPDTVTGGPVRIQFTNHGEEDHHAQFLRLNDGVTVADFQAKLMEVMMLIPTEGEGAAMQIFELVTADGGPSVIGAHQEMEIVADLRPGNYVMVCFVPSPDGVPHIAKGMMHPFTVVGPTGTATAPEADFTVDLTDFAFSELPALTAGRAVIEVTNSGPEPHEMVVVRLDGITVEQLGQMLEAGPPPPGTAPPGPPPFRFVGGVQGMMAGQRAWVTLDLEAGDYVLLCFIPSPANDGHPHMHLGMVKPFTVS